MAMNVPCMRPQQHRTDAEGVGYDAATAEGYEEPTEDPYEKKQIKERHFLPAHHRLPLPFAIRLSLRCTDAFPDRGSSPHQACSLLCIGAAASSCLCRRKWLSKKNDPRIWRAVLQPCCFAGVSCRGVFCLRRWLQSGGRSTKQMPSTPFYL